MSMLVYTPDAPLPGEKPSATSSGKMLSSSRRGCEQERAIMCSRWACLFAEFTSLSRHARPLFNNEDRGGLDVDG